MKDIIFKTLMLKGEAGSTLVSMEKTGHSGTTDTYTITFDDGSTTDIYISNLSSVDSVQLTSQTDTEDTYTVTLSDGSTQSFSVKNHNADIEAISEELAAGLASIEADLNDQSALLNARMDTFTSLPSGSTAGNAELIDIRVGADGKTYASAGAATRGQASYLTDNIKDTRSALYYESDITGDIVEGYYIKTAIDVGNVVDLTPVENSSFAYIIRPCMEGEKFVITGSSGGNPRLWAFIGAGDKMISFASSSITGTDLELTAPAGSVKAVFNVALYAARSIIQKHAMLSVKEYVDNGVDPISESLLVDKNISEGFETGYIALNVVIGNVVNLNPVTEATRGHKIINTAAGTKYRVYGNSANAPRLWGFIDADSKLLSVASGYVDINGDIITAPENAAKLILNTFQSSPTTVYLCDGEIAADAADKLETASETAATNNEILDQITLTSRQLFNRHTIIENKAYSADGQSIIDDNTKCLSDFIPIDGGAGYRLLACVGRLLFFTVDKQYITDYAASSYETAVSTTAPATAYYLRLEMTKYFYPYAQTMVAKGASLGKDIRFGASVNKAIIENNPEYEFSDIQIPKEYSAIGIKAVDGSEDFDDDNPSVSQLYAAYDALMADFPDYIKRADFGMDESETYHMYAYYFTPEDVPTEYDMYRKPYPKVNIRSGIHGNGTLGDSNINLFCLYYLMKSICYNWRESEALEYLRWNVRFAILPLQNPWGFENKKRYNSNGVDINRNFSVGWQLGTSGNPDYGGASPMSESETNNIVAFEQANADAIFSVDVHSQGDVPDQSHMSYMSVFVASEMFYPAKSLVTKISHIWDSQNIPNLQKMNYHGYVACEFTGWGTGTSYIAAMIGTPALTLEGFKNFDGSSYSNGSAEIVKMVADQLGYGVLLGLNHFK